MKENVKRMGNLFEVADYLNFDKKSSFSVPFIGRGNIWIDNNYDYSTVELAQDIIFEALNRTAPGQLQITGYDSELSGVFAPFSSLTSGEMNLISILQNENEFDDYLDFLWHHIESVQDVIQGRERDLITFRSKVGRPTESYNLIVINMNIGFLDSEQRVKLGKLMKEGPAYGVSFLIISTANMRIIDSRGEHIPFKVEYLARNVSILEPSQQGVTVDGKYTIDLVHKDATEIINMCSILIELAKNSSLPSINFLTVHGEGKSYWQGNSKDGLTFSIGKYGVEDVHITIGDEVNQRHNIMITGAVGQGKSNLLSVIIHSLAHYYSPNELEMYLLDFKEGVSLKAFTNLNYEFYLPHARTIALEADVTFGLAVLEHLHSEYIKRMKILKKYNAKSLKELRDLTNLRMARIVVVIDEFQMLFGDDFNKGTQIVELLEQSIRLFRAAGIHFILASQSLSGNPIFTQKSDVIMSQIPIRIAHKNSKNESRHILSINNDSAAYLRPHEAIVNMDYGELSQNLKTIVAFADEKILSQLRRTWWLRAKDAIPAPYVFENDKAISIKEYSLSIDRKAGSEPQAALGIKMSVGGDLLYTQLPNEFGRNIALIGNQPKDKKTAIGTIESIAVSLAEYHNKGEARFIFIDFRYQSREEFYKNYAEVIAEIESKNHKIDIFLEDEFNEFIENTNSYHVDHKQYVFGIEMDYWQYEPKQFGGGTNLKDFVEKASAYGTHFVGWWMKPSAFNDQVTNYGKTEAFNTKILFKVDEQSAQSLFGPTVQWAPSDMRILVSDFIENNQEFTAIPFVSLDFKEGE